MKEWLLLNKRYFFAFFVYFFGFPCNGQHGFMSTFYQNDEASNLAFVCSEFQDHYIFGGAYFDDTIGRWTGFYGGVDDTGKTRLLASERKDTIFGFSVENKMVTDGEAFYLLGNNSLLSYNPNLDISQIKVKFDLKRDNKYCHGLNIDHNKNFIFSYGTTPINTNDRDIGLLKFRDSVLLTFQDIDPTVKSHCGRPLISADGSIYLTCADLSFDPLKNDTRYILCLDSNFNKKFSTKNSVEEITLSYGYGSFLDRFGNILFIGNDRVLNGNSIEYIPRVVKADSLGKIIWNKKVSLPQLYNYEGWGRWQNIIESNNNDGYILVGSHFTGSPQNDTSRCDALICKISYEGETLWSKKYAFRAGNNKVYCALNDVVPTSDGGYFAVGESINASASSNEISDPPGFRAILLKMDKDGNIEPDTSSLVNEIENIVNHLEIFPNPCNHNCFFRQTSFEPVLVKIFNIEGDLIEEFTCEHNIITVLNTMAYKTGTYYVYTYINDKNTGVFPLIKH